MAVLVELDGDRRQPGHLREDRVTVESGLAHHNPITGPGDRMQDLHRHARRPRTEDDLLVANSNTVPDQPPQLLGQELRIAIGRIDAAPQRRPRRWERRKWTLVERQR